ncbi:MAG: DUF5696 domain-containing protein [Chloroflexi bacterium]|nr:DUF5696 domain-containing protein [Chloroflexota bacterium]
MKLSLARGWRIARYFVPLILLLTILPIAPATAAPAFDAAKELGPEFEQVSQVEHLSLFLNKTNSQLAVFDDREDGRLWRSSPILENPEAVSDSIKARLNSVVIVEYTDKVRTQTRVADIISDQPSMTFDPIDGGIRVDYLFDELNIGFAIRYWLEDDRLVVGVDEDSIRETEERLLVTLDIMPFLGAATNEETGYLFVPDGPGAIVHFRPEQPEYRHNFLAEVYGPALFSFEPEQQQGPIPVPVFGLVRGSTAFSGIVTKGDMDVNISAALSYTALGYNRISGQFIFRRKAPFPLRRASFVTRFEQERVEGDREVKYAFLRGYDATYVGMAKNYREFLMSERGLQQLEEANPFLHLRIFMAMQRQAFPRDQFITMTTFDEALDMLKSLKEERGLDNLRVTLVGWSQDGYDWSLPKRLPPEGKLGGDEGLRAVSNYANANNIPVYLEDNYLFGFRNIDSFFRFNPLTDVIRGANRLPITTNYVGFKRKEDEPHTEVQLIRPEIARDRYAAGDIAKMGEYGISGVEFRFFGKVALNHYPILFSGRSGFTTGLRFLGLGGIVFLGLYIVLVGTRRAGDSMFGQFIGGPLWRPIATGALLIVLAAGLVNEVRTARQPVDTEQGGTKLSRQEFVGVWKDIIDISKQETGTAVVQGANAYMLDTTDFFTRIPLDRYNYVFSEETVPFFPLAVHGLIRYTGDESNLRSDRDEFLRAIEYGALPTFELTSNPSVLLTRTQYNRLYSSRFADWEPQIVDEYELFVKQLGYTVNQLMEDHRQIADGVYETVYEDGTRVIVNYKTRRYTDGENAVEGQNYLIIPPRR